MKKSILRRIYIVRYHLYKIASELSSDVSVAPVLWKAEGGGLQIWAQPGQVSNTIRSYLKIKK